MSTSIIGMKEKLLRLLLLLSVVLYSYRRNGDDKSILNERGYSSSLAVLNEKEIKETNGKLRNGSWVLVKYTRG